MNSKFDLRRLSKKRINTIKEEPEKNSDSNLSINNNMNENIENMIPLQFSDSENSNKNKKLNERGSIFLNKEQENMMKFLRKTRDKYKNRKSTIKYKKNLGIVVEDINLDQVDEEKRNILHKACLQIKKTIIEDLSPTLTKEYVNKLDKFGNSPLILACKLPLKNYNAERNKIIEILIEKGANIQCIEPINGWTALHWCCFNGDLFSAKTLVKNGANFFLPSKKGFFPIDLAGKKSNRELVQYLIGILVKFLEKIKNYELLNEKIIEKYSKEIFNKRDLNGNLTYKEEDINENNNDNGLRKNNTKEELSNFEKICQTLYLRLYTEHCLYWLCYYNYYDEMINKFLTTFYAHPSFPIFCLEKRNAFHAACIQGSKRPFEILLKYYEERKEEREKLYGIKSKKQVAINMESTPDNKVYKILYPYEFQTYKKIFESNIFFNKKYKNYLSSHFFELIYPKSYVENLSFEQIVDQEGNTPIVLAAKNNQYDFLYFLQEKELIKNMDNIFNLDNKVGYCGYYYMKDIEFKNNLIRNNNKKIYPIPPVVLELNRNESTRASINLIMKIGVSEKLEIELMEHIDKNRLYILININENYFYQQAEKDKLHIKLSNKNLKLPFENNQKYISSVEPFLSRHYQYIITKTISHLLDIEMLKDQKILKDIFLTHNPNVTTKIFNTIIKQKFYWPNPLCFIHDYFFEGKNINYYQIQLLYRYFGQAISMYYAFYGFFTVIYGPLAFVSLLYTLIYLKSIFNSNDMYPICFLVFAFWNLLAMSKWKRKSEEIQHKWGMKISPDQQKMRIEYKGDEYYTDLEAPLEKNGSVFESIRSFFISLPPVLIFIGITIVSSYFVTLWENKVQNEKNFFFKFFPSFVRALSLVIIFYVYDNIILYTTNIANIKYEDEYEFSLIFRIFIFRFVIDFISIFYNVFFTKNIYRLKVLLYTNIILRFIAEIIIRIIYPIISNNISRRIYFKKVEKRAKIHKISNKINKKNIDDLKANLKQSENERLKNENSKENIDNEYNIEKYNKVSMITGNILSEKNNDLLNINPDFIEIQSSLVRKRSLFYDYADIFMIHSLISSFIIIIPFGPLICFFFSIFSQNARLYLDIFYLKRPTPLSCRGIRIWNRILEFNSIFMTVTNCFLYYYYGSNNYLTEKVAKNTEFSMFSNERGLIIIMCAEHIIIIIQYLLKYSIPEVPKWVKKERENLLGYYSVLNSDKERKQSIELTLGIEKLRSELDKLNNDIKEQKNLIRKYENNVGDYKTKLLKKDGKIKEYSDILNILYNSVRKKIHSVEKTSYPRLRSLVIKDKKIEDIEYDNFEDKYNERDLELFYSFRKTQNFIDIKFDLVLQKLVNNINIPNSSNIFELNKYKYYKFDNKDFDDWKKDLRKTYCFYQMKKTFDFIENIILSKKLEFFLNNNNSPIAVCSTCSNKAAEFKCEDCQELFCPYCKSIHLSNILWENHKISYYLLPLKENINDETIQISFIKGESFSFPTSMINNLGYRDLITIFDILYSRYISNNGINDKNEVIFKEDIYKKIDFFMKLETVPAKVIEEQVEFLSNEEISFNLTEIFFINRICFKNFKYFGANTTINEIYLPLKNLQISTFEKKIIIVLNLLDIYDNKLILKNEVIKLFIFTNYQSFDEDFSLDNIINDIFRNNKDFIEISEAYNNIIYNPKLSSVFKYLLQCNNDEEINIDT